MYQVAFFGYNSTMKKSKWTTAQINLLLQKIASERARMHAFREVAAKLGRKANSVRNYYYKHHAQEKNQIVPFGPQETKHLLREIILGTSRGESVRSICMKLASDDRAKMLRLQNKYRTVLSKNPAQIERIAKNLEAQGYLVKQPAPTATPAKIIQMPQQKRISDTDINNLFAGLVRLIKSNASEEIEKLKAEIERLKGEVRAVKKV